MAEQSKGSGGGGNELSMEKRLLLAFILMGAVLFLTPYLYKPEPPVEPAAPAETAGEVVEETPVEAPAKPEVKPEVKAPAKEPESPPEDDAVPSATVAAEAEETVVIETDVYKVVFSNRGAVVKSWVLKDYPDKDGQPLELVNPGGVEELGYPFQLGFPDGAPALDPNSGLFAVTKSGDGLGVEFEFSNGVTRYEKAFQFDRSQYVVQIRSAANRDGHELPHFLVWRGGFGDMTTFRASTNQHTVYYDTAENKLVVNDPDEAEDGPITFEGRYDFLGLEDAYFAAVALPRNGAPISFRIFTDLLTPEGEEKPLPHVGAAIGGRGTINVPMFVGPKDLQLLKEVDPRLQQMVDYGWFALLAKPIFLAMQWLEANYVHNWGWSIVLVTLAINLILFPLKLTSLKSMKKMQALQPEVKKIQEKYKGLSMRDPKKQKQNEELMALYQKHGVNPMGGCLPMILQIPFFFAFYKVLRVAIELRGADWLWVSDLSQPETLPIRILPVAMVVSQFAMQKMTPTTAVGSSSQQKMMLLMPLFMGFMFYQFSSGLVLYWLTSNVVGAAQQLLINKMGDTPKVAEAEKPQIKPKKKGRRK